MLPYHLTWISSQTCGHNYFESDPFYGASHVPDHIIGKTLMAVPKDNRELQAVEGKYV